MILMIKISQKLFSIEGIIYFKDIIITCKACELVLVFLRRKIYPFRATKPLFQEFSLRLIIMKCKLQLVAFVQYPFMALETLLRFKFYLTLTTLFRINHLSRTCSFREKYFYSLKDSSIPWGDKKTLPLELEEIKPMTKRESICSSSFLANFAFSFISQELSTKGLNWILILTYPNIPTS